MKTNASCRPVSRVLPGLGFLLAGALLGRHVVRRRRRMPMEGRLALITGSSRGLGLAIAREFARHRARIALCARSEEELASAAGMLRGKGADVFTFVCDLREATQIAHLIHDVQRQCGPIDVLVNNAGTISVGPLETMSVDDFRDIMDVNFWSAVHTTMAVIPGMKARRRGRIVNISSIGGKMPVPHLSAYCTSKFALAGYSAALRSELAKDGVLVTTVSPGLMRTGSPRNAYFKGKHRAEYAWFALSDGMPGLSISAASAARRIVDAAIFGEAEVILGLPAKIAAAMFGVAPGLSAEIAALVNRLLPSSSDSSSRAGSESESWITRSPLGFFNHRAEEQLNQIPSQSE